MRPESHPPSFSENDPIVKNSQIDLNAADLVLGSVGSQGLTSGGITTENPADQQQKAPFIIPNLSSVGSRINTEGGDDDQIMENEFFKGHDESEIAAAMIRGSSSSNIN